MDQSERMKNIDLWSYWEVIVRRRWVLAAFAGALVVFTAIYSFVIPPRYQATSTLLIEEETSRFLSISETFSDQAQVMRDLRGYNTQMQLLKSRSLAERVARKLNLLARPEFGAGKSGRRDLFSRVKYVLTLRWLRPKKAGSEEADNPYSGIANALVERTEIAPVRDTKLVAVRFNASSPLLAAEIVNTLAEESISFSIEKRFSTTQQASNWLSEQVEGLRQDLAAKEKELLLYSQDKDIVYLSESESAAVKSFSNLSDAHNRATLDRINAEVEYRALKNFEGDSVSQFISDPGTLQLKTEYTRIRAEFEEKGKQFKPDHPEMVGLRARLDSLVEEINKAVQAAESRYRTAQQKEASIKATLEKQRADVTKLENNAITYNSIRGEVESKRRLLTTLLERQSETQISAQLRGLNASNISIIDPAEAPKRPVSPDKKKNLLLSLLLGLLGGTGLCFLLESLDDTLKGPKDVERLTGLSSLGVIPYLPPQGQTKGRRYGSYFRPRYSTGQLDNNKEHTVPEVKEIELVNHLHPEMSLAEDYRTVRTSILLSRADKPPKVIAFSSALPQEGKTATVVNLAVSFAQLEERVLIVDTDLRKPRLHRLFKVRNIGGLTTFLTGKAPLKEVIQKTFVENVWLIPSGPIPPNPAELLNAHKMKDLVNEISQIFDLVLLDSPPLLAVIDSVVISSLADSTILVVQGGKTRQKPFAKAVEELKRVRANIIGVVFNGVDVRGRGGPYSDYYTYAAYGYSGTDETDI